VINNKRVLIVTPAWNEAGAIYQVIRELRGELPGADVLVVDDGSSDDTARLAHAAGAAVAHLPYNLGVGGAMRLGYRYGRDHDFDVVIQLDADGQHDPRYIPKLVDAIDDADLVIGSRFAESDQRGSAAESDQRGSVGGESEYRVRGPRLWAMRLLAAVISLIAHTRLTDTTSGFRAANRRTIELFAGWYPVEYLGDTVETLVYAARRGFRIRQVPVAMRARIAGAPSHSPIKSMVYLGRAFAILLLALIRR